MLQPRTRTILALLFYCTLAKAIDQGTDNPLDSLLFQSFSPVSDWNAENNVKSSFNLISSITKVFHTDHHVTAPLSTHIQFNTLNESQSHPMISDSWTDKTTGLIEPTVTSDQWNWSNLNTLTLSTSSNGKKNMFSMLTPVAELASLNSESDFFTSSSSTIDTKTDPTLSTELNSLPSHIPIIPTKVRNSKATNFYGTKILKKDTYLYLSSFYTSDLRLEPTKVIDSTGIASSTQTNALLVTTVPPAQNEGQYFVAFKSDDCPKIKINKFDLELTRALGALGVLNVTANIARTKCRTQLNVNITATGPLSAIKLLEQSKKRNITITVFNRMFKIIDIQQLNGAATNETDVVNSTTTVITAIRKNEFNAYVAVGTCFVLVLLVCVTVCCIKCWAKDPNKRLPSIRNSHSPLNAEDYTLTPLPRPTSLYVDYYRNSFSPDMRSTTSAGSIASTSPTVEKVVQPFDTSIVPLEDFVVSTISDDSRRNSVESTTTQNSFNHLPGANPRLLYLNSMTDSRERLNPKYMTNAQVASGGVSNPTYQRY